MTKTTNHLTLHQRIELSYFTASCYFKLKIIPLILATSQPANYTLTHHDFRNLYLQAGLHTMHTYSYFLYAQSYVY